MSITWSDVAEADLDDLYDYIARDVPYYAEQFVDRLMEAVGTLRDHPRLGRRVPEADDRDDVRELIFQGYRIIYLVTQSTCIYRPSSTAAGIWRGKPRSRGRSSKNSRTLSQALLRCSQSKPIRALCSKPCWNIMHPYSEQSVAHETKKTWPFFRNSYRKISLIKPICLD
jgi:plasmid stabilization system protein ParE